MQEYRHSQSLSPRFLNRIILIFLRFPSQLSVMLVFRCCAALANVCLFIQSLLTRFYLCKDLSGILEKCLLHILSGQG